MIRGTTAQFKFKLPYLAEDVSSATITFWQPGNNDFGEPIRRTLSDCSKSDYTLYVSLDPASTMRFSDKFKAKVQLRAQSGGTIFASREQLITVYPINDAVIDPELPPPDEEGWIILDGESVAD